MAYATTADVAARLGRALNPGEVTQVTAYLEDAEAVIRSALPNILLDIEGNDALAKNLRSVECSAVLRAARITDAVQAVYPDTEDWTSPPNTSRANVTILFSEWLKLGLPWYSAWSPSEALMRDRRPPGFFSDMHPEWGPGWNYGSYDDA